MKKGNLIWLLVGGAAVYLFFALKRGADKPIIGGIPPSKYDAKKKAASMKDDEIRDLLVAGCLVGRRPRPEIEELRRALREEANKRKLSIPKCPEGYTLLGKKA